MPDAVTNVNNQVMSYITGIKFLDIIGWIIFGVILIGVGFYFFTWYKNKKIFNKQITILDIIGIYFEPIGKDVAKTVKFVSGGFEILYLKKNKTWKISFGSKVGKNSYYFFIMPDGYWYNGLLSANMFMIDKLKGLVPIVTTNPSMRSQYTALEKQIDLLHANKKTFWDQYGQWVLAIGFLLVAGVFLWLNYQEYAKAMASQNLFIDKLGTMLDKINQMAGNVQANVPSNLIPIK